MAKTESKKSDLEGTIEKLSNKIDKDAARSAALKEEVVELEAELAALAKTQSEMDKIRAEENANYKVASSELKQGLTGVRKALGVLRDYYGSAAALVQEDQPAPPQQHAKAGGA